MLGLELRDTSALAVAVAADGVVRERAEVGAGSQLATAAIAALDRLLASSRTVSPLGIAAVAPDSADCRDALTALAARRATTLVDRVVASGTAAAVAEAWVGAARGARDVMFLAIEDHATAGILRAGAPVTGAHGRGPSAAWLALNPVDREDYRKIGCFEAEVATPGIVRRLVWRMKAGDHSSVLDAVKGDFGAITAEHVLAAARASDGLAISVMRDTAKYLGMAAANLIALGDPEVLVLGGIMASAADLLLEPIRAELARRLPPPLLKTVSVVPAALGADAAAIGAARLADAAVR